MITLDHLKALAKEHNMKCSYMNKDEIIGLLLDKQIITISDLRNPAVVGEKKEPVKLEVDPNKYAYLKAIRTNRKLLKYMIGKQVKLMFILQHISCGEPSI